MRSAVARQVSVAAAESVAAHRTRAAARLADGDADSVRARAAHRPCRGLRRGERASAEVLAPQSAFGVHLGNGSVDTRRLARTNLSRTVRARRLARRGGGGSGDPRGVPRAGFVRTSRNDAL